MSERMTSKERLLTAIAGGKPDRVPVIPDFSNMIPVKMTGKPFWDIYLYGKPPLQQAYRKAAKYFGIDGWYFEGHLQFKRKVTTEVKSEILSRSAERIIRRTTYDTPAGQLWSETTFLPADPPTNTRKMVKNLEEDFPKIRYLYSDIVGYDASSVPEHRALCGDDGIYTMGHISYPGMHMWTEYFDGNLQSAVYAYYDHPEIFDEWAALMDKDAVQQAEIVLDEKPDVLFLGGSGTLTLSSPELVRKFTIPTIKKICRMAKEAGILTMLHSCGKSMAFLEMLVDETELCCINPLEEPPMGDVNLAEVKKLYGDRICLMGNLPTTSVMLRGSVNDVERAAKKAIDDAGAGGGFLLSTGDQCGRDTPEANIFKLVEVAKTYGRYD